MAAKKNADTKPAAKKTAAPKAEKPAADKKNGVTRPKPGSQVAKVWDQADKITAKNKTTATRAEVLKACEGMNVATIATQYGKWRRYNGVKGRLSAAE